MLTRVQYEQTCNAISDKPQTMRKLNGACCRVNEYLIFNSATIA